MGRVEGDGVKLELGSGQRPTPGYMTSDCNAFDGIDFVCDPEKIALKSGSLDEILALGVIEHLTFAQVDLTLTNCFRMLRSGGEFVFDIPDLYEWCKLYVKSVMDVPTPFTREHILSTLYGWQRWPGDEHKSGHSKESITRALNRACFRKIDFGVDLMFERGHDRRRFHRPEDAHLYIVATKA